MSPAHDDTVSTAAWENAMRILTAFALGCCLACGPGCGQKSATNDRGDIMKLQLTSSAFAEGAAIPEKYTGDDANVSPPLQWDEPPAETKSFALICDDP